VQHPPFQNTPQRLYQPEYKPAVSVFAVVERDESFCSGTESQVEGLCRFIFHFT